MKISWKTVELNPNSDASEWLITIEYKLESGHGFSNGTRLEVRVSVVTRE